MRWLIYTLSFVIAWGVAWGIQVLVVQALFGNPTIVNTLGSLGLPSLGGLAAFTLAYGLATRVRPGLGYWAVALGVVALSGALTLGLIFLGIATPIEAACIWIAFLFVIGGFLTRLLHRVPA